MTTQRTTEPVVSSTDQARPAVPEQILTGGIIAIGRGLPADNLIRIGVGLAAGGVGAFEVTLNSPDALTGIETLARRFGPAELLIGAGTVLTIDGAFRAIDAGARFIVMPTMDPAIIEAVAARGVPTFPGAMTPTEVLAAWRAGAAAVKLFPASAVGPAFIREMRGPLAEIPLIPTGGVTLETAPAFIAAGAIAVGMGSWLTGDGDPVGIEARGTQVVAAVAAARFPAEASAAGRT